MAALRISAIAWMMSMVKLRLQKGGFNIPVAPIILIDAIKKRILSESPRIMQVVKNPFMAMVMRAFGKQAATLMRIHEIYIQKVIQQNVVPYDHKSLLTNWHLDDVPFRKEFWEKFRPAEFNK